MHNQSSGSAWVVVRNSGRWTKVFERTWKKKEKDKNKTNSSPRDCLFFQYLLLDIIYNIGIHSQQPCWETGTIQCFIRGRSREGAYWVRTPWIEFVYFEDNQYQKKKVMWCDYVIYMMTLHPSLSEILDPLVFRDCKSQRRTFRFFVAQYHWRKTSLYTVLVLTQDGIVAVPFFSSCVEYSGCTTQILNTSNEILKNKKVFLWIWQNPDSRLLT